MLQASERINFYLFKASVFSKKKKLFTSISRSYRKQIKSLFLRLINFQIADTPLPVVMLYDAVDSYQMEGKLIKKHRVILIPFYESSSFFGLPVQVCTL